GESPFCMTFAFFYRASLGGPDERREQKFATLVGDHFGMSPTNILLTPQTVKFGKAASKIERTVMNRILWQPG
ncbi:hypothetical protein P4506_12095, partial [Geobacillus stearothermophilus]